MLKQDIANEILRLLEIKEEPGDTSAGSTVTKQTWEKILTKVNEIIIEKK